MSKLGRISIFTHPRTAHLMRVHVCIHTTQNRKLKGDNTVTELQSLSLNFLFVIAYYYGGAATRTAGCAGSGTYYGKYFPRSSCLDAYSDNWCFLN